jgi:hypothetical protein
MSLKTLALTVLMGAAVALCSAPSSADAGWRRAYRYGYGYPTYGYTYAYPSYGYTYSYPGYYYAPRSYYYGAPYYGGYQYGYAPYYGRGAYVGPNSAFFYGPRGGFRIRY